MPGRGLGSVDSVQKTKKPGVLPAPMELRAESHTIKSPQKRSSRTAVAGAAKARQMEL